MNEFKIGRYIFDFSIGCDMGDMEFEKERERKTLRTHIYGTQDMSVSHPYKRKMLGTDDAATHMLVTRPMHPNL